MKEDNIEKRILLEALICEREGMLAENKNSMLFTHHIAYDDNAFFELAEEMRSILK